MSGRRIMLTVLLALACVPAGVTAASASGRITREQGLANIVAAMDRNFPGWSDPSVLDQRDCYWKSTRRVFFCGILWELGDSRQRYVKATATARFTTLKARTCRYTRLSNGSYRHRCHYNAPIVIRNQ